MTGMILAATAIPNWFVVVMGLGTVFVGLICIVLILKILGAVVGRAVQNNTQPKQTVPAAAAAPVTASAAEKPMSPEERQKLLAAISAVIAEELGTDVSAIRIRSFKKVS